MMTEKYKILGKYIKDLSSETKDVETYLFVRDNISKYQLGIDITSKALKNKMIEVNTTLKFEDKEKVKKNHILRWFLQQSSKLVMKLKKRKN